MEVCNIIIWVWGAAGITVSTLSLIFHDDVQKWARISNNVFFGAERLTAVLVGFWMIREIAKITHIEPIKFAIYIGWSAIGTAICALIVGLMFKRNTTWWRIGRKIAYCALLYFMILLGLYLINYFK